MNAEKTVQAGAANRTMREGRAQLAQYLAQQPESKQVFHKWMKVFEMASLAIIVGAFAVAMYVSINHAAVPPIAIPIAWLAFPVSVAPLMILLGLHSIVLRASPPVFLPGRRQQFVTGSKAVWSGSGLVLMALLVGAFWGMFAWSVWSGNMALTMSYVRILATVVTIAIPISMVLAFVQQLVRFR